MAITNARRLADFGSGIGTEGSVLELDNAQQRVGIGTTNPQSTLQVGVAITMDGTAGVITATSYTGSGANLTNLPAATAITGTPDITVRNITGVAATFTGVLTYEDVTNVDSVGIVTARGGLEVGAAGVGGTVSALGHVEFVGVTTIGLGLTLTDDIEARFGNSGDLRIYHNGTHSYIVDSGTGTLRLEASELGILSADGSETMAQFVENAGVSLRYNNNTKFQTDPGGTITTGISTADGFSVGDNEYITVGVGSDLTIYHDSSNSYIQEDGTGQIIIRGWAPEIQAGFSPSSGRSTGETAIKAITDGAVELYYNAIKQLSTRSDGIEIHAASGAEAMIYMTADAGEDATDKYRLVAQDGGDWLVQRYTGSAYSSELRVKSAGGVQANYLGSQKLLTITEGVKVTGVTSTTSLSVGPGVLQEKLYNVASALTGTVNFDVVDNGLVQYYTTNSSGTFVVNLRGDGSTTFNSLMDIGKTTVFTLYSAQNSASYYMTDFQIDGSSITEKWNGGSAPSAGTASGTDVYTFNIMKTADATFTVFATFSNFA